MYVDCRTFNFPKPSARLASTICFSKQLTHSCEKISKYHRAGWFIGNKLRSHGMKFITNNRWKKSGRSRPFNSCCRQVFTRSIEAIDLSISTLFIAHSATKHMLLLRLLRPSYAENSQKKHLLFWHPMRGSRYTLRIWPCNLNRS